MIEVLISITQNFNESLGSDQGAHYATPDLLDNTQALMDSLNEHSVYQIKKGRKLKEDEIVKDVILDGIHSLSKEDKTPLTDYNEAFYCLQQRH